MLVIYLKQPQKCFVKWAILGVFSIYFRPFKQTLQFLQQIYVKIFMTIQYTAQPLEPLEHKSPPITTRPGLPPYQPEKCCKNKFTAKRDSN